MVDYSLDLWTSDSLQALIDSFLQNDTWGGGGGGVFFWGGLRG